MKMLAVKNFTFFNLHAFSAFICNSFYYMLYFVSLIYSYLFYILISVVIQRFITSEDVWWNIRNVKLKSFFSFQKCVYISLCLSDHHWLFVSS